MNDLVSGSVRDDLILDRAPGRSWSVSPSLTSADYETARDKNRVAAEARDIVETNPFARSAKRSTVDSIIGVSLNLKFEPVSELLGVSDDEAEAYADMIEAHWNLAAKSPLNHFDAQRKQTFDGLLRSAYAQFYVSGETLGTIEWKPSPNGQGTCLNLIDSERLSDPHGMRDMTGKRRMGVDIDIHGAPIGYHIAETHLSDAWIWGAQKQFMWKYVPAATPWGRPLVLHVFDMDRPHMTRGKSGFHSTLLPMRMLSEYNMTELESAAVRATYAAVIESELDYEKAMQVIGADNREAISKNPALDMTLRYMEQGAKFYKGQDFKFGKSKVAHLLPNESIKLLQGNGSSNINDFTNTNLYPIASGLGVDFATLTKNFSNTNYSGARASMFDIWRSYEVRRDSFTRAVPCRIFAAWLEEMIVLRGVIPMLGKKNFYEVQDAITNARFVGWGKPRLDPYKEAMADSVELKMGLRSIPDLCAERGTDYRKVMRDVKRTKNLMESLDLKPEDINWDLLAVKMKADAMTANSEAGGGTNA